MRFDDVAARIGPMYGLTTMIDSPASVDIRQPEVERLTLGGAREKLAHMLQMREDARSDAAYWGYDSQCAYWQCIVSLLEAAQIVGRDLLPDVEIPDLSGQVVMDANWDLIQFGARVLELAQA